METPAAGAARLSSLLFTVGAGRTGPGHNPRRLAATSPLSPSVCVSVCVSRSGAEEEEEEEGVGRRRWGREAAGSSTARAAVSGGGVSRGERLAVSACQQQPASRSSSCAPPGGSSPVRRPLLQADASCSLSAPRGIAPPFSIAFPGEGACADCQARPSVALERGALAYKSVHSADGPGLLARVRLKEQQVNCT